MNEGARVCACERGPRAGGAGTESSGVAGNAIAEGWLHLRFSRYALLHFYGPLRALATRASTRAA